MAETFGQNGHLAPRTRAWFANSFPGGLNRSSAVLASVVIVLAGLRAILAVATGFTGDEAYTVVIARNLALSYFDHPPLHQWITHAAAATFGETAFARLPFFMMAIGISVPIFFMTRRLYDARAAWWAVFAFNVTPYFVLWPDGLIIPDVPMLLALAFAGWLLADIIFGGRAKGDWQFGRWALVGVAMGLAGLSKYSAVMAAVSLFGFLASSRSYRFWLVRPEPYIGACIALMVFSPVAIWNVQHGWASFSFQLNRVGNGEDFQPLRMRWFLEALGAQLAMISPWILLPFGGALAGLVKHRTYLLQERFILWLCGVPLTLFLVMPLFGGKSIPHWSDSGWLFSYPIIGAWLARQGLSKMRPWAEASGMLVAGAVVLYFCVLHFGLPGFWKPGKDPLRWSYNWRSDDWRARQAVGVNPPTPVANPPKLVFANTWRVGGKAGIMFGPTTKVCVFSKDARGFGFTCDPEQWIGHDALVVIPEPDLADALPVIQPYFEAIGPVSPYDMGGRGGPGRRIAMFVGHNLLRWPGARRNEPAPK